MLSAARVVKKAPWWSLFVFCLLSPALLAQAAPSGGAAAPAASASDDKPVPNAAIASAHPQATAAGAAILQAGGNAFDAAIALTAALAVVEPYGSGLGGGGFWLLHRAGDQHQVMIDGRERAPLAASRDMYLDAAGEPVPGASINGPLAAGIPGTPAAIVHLAQHYGRLPLHVTLAPAIALARDGFVVDAAYQRMARWRLSALQASAAAAEQFLQEGQLPVIGWRLRQPDLAQALERIAEQGFDGFYRGEQAQRLVDGVRAAGGIWQLQDLDEYRVVERAPLVGEFEGHRIISAPLPSSGGIVLLQLFKQLQQMPWYDQPSANKVHLMVEAMRRAYEDRARYLGDTDFVQVPLEMLLSDDYIRARLRDLKLDQASVSRPLEGAANPKGEDTTHFSVIDEAGNRVAATLSVNYPFGSGFVPPGTGILLNDEMDDFSIKPGTANVYGLVGNEANAIAPGKRMLSSMSPTFIEHQDRVAILGTPGGSRIISMLLIGSLQAMGGQPVSHWVARARFHHQYLPDEIQYEPGALTELTREALAAKGHQLKELNDNYGNMQAVLWDKAQARVSAASDPRGIGAPWVGNVSEPVLETADEPAARVEAAKPSE